MNLEKVIEVKEMRKLQYYRSRLHCENSDMQVAALDIDSYTRRVGLNMLDIFPENIHPNLCRAKSFNFKDNHLEEINFLRGSDRQFWEVKDISLLDEMFEILESKTVIAIDTELDTDYSFIPIISLIQISCDTHDFVIYAIELHAYIANCLKQIFLSPNILKVVFSPNDIEYFKRDFGLFFCYAVDVQYVEKACKKLSNFPSFQDVVFTYLNKKISKKFQNFPFRLRPLPAEVVQYARLDSMLLLEVWEKMKIVHKVKLLDEYDYKYLDEYICRQYKLPTVHFPSVVFERAKKILNEHQKILWVKDKFLNVFARVWMWTRNTARLRDVPVSKVLKMNEIVRLTVVQPKNVHMLNCILSSVSDWKEICKESLIGAIELGRTTDYVEPDSDNCPKVKRIQYRNNDSDDDEDKNITDEEVEVYHHVGPQVSEPNDEEWVSVLPPNVTNKSTYDNDKIEIEKPSNKDTSQDNNNEESDYEFEITLTNDLCHDDVQYTISNDICKNVTENENVEENDNVNVGNVEVESEAVPDFAVKVNFETQVPIPILSNENSVESKFSNITKFEEVTKFDLLHHWDEIRKNIEDKNLINRLNRKRKCIKQFETNKAVKAQGEPLIPFKRFSKWSNL